MIITWMSNIKESTYYLDNGSHLGQLRRTARHDKHDKITMGFLFYGHHLRQLRRRRRRSTRRRAIPLDAISMTKSIHGFPFLSYKGMGLRLGPFGPPNVRY